MEIVCDTKSLAEAVSTVLRAVAGSTTVPILEGILFVADGSHLKLTGYDLEMAITTSIEATVKKPGEIVLKAKLLADMLRTLSGETVTIQCSETNSTHIQSGITEYDLMGINAADYPDLPTPDIDTAFEIDPSELASMISTTVYAVSTDTKKPTLNGELFSILPDELTIVALDGFRLAISKHPIQSDISLQIIVPAKACSEVSKIFSDSETPIKVDANRRYIVFSNQQYTLMTRLIEGEFHNYAASIPEGYKTRVTVDVQQFEKSVERCSVIITERLKNPLRITFSDKIEIRCQTQLGKVNDQLEAEIEGEPIEMGFNYRYLLDALRYSGCDRIVLELSGAISPVKVLPAEGDDFLFLVLPVRFKND